MWYGRLVGMLALLLVAIAPLDGAAQEIEAVGESVVLDRPWPGVSTEQPMILGEAGEIVVEQELVPPAPLATEPADSGLSWILPRSPPAVAGQSVAYPNVRLTGFFHLDSVHFSQSDNNRATLGDIQNGTTFRRARLAAVGNVAERVSYNFEVDFAQSQARFVDVWGQIDDTPLGNLRIGRFRQPLGMTDLTSVRDLAFLERPALFALSPFRQTGIMLFDTVGDNQATWAVSGFRGQSDNFGNVYGDNGGHGVAHRITFLPWNADPSRLIHIGWGHSYLDPARDQLLYASQNEVFVGQNPILGPGGLDVLPIDFVPPAVVTGVFDADSVNVFNVEGAAALGGAVWQSEYRWNRVELPSGESAVVHGGYLQWRYMLTGEVIPYNYAGGVFGRVTPRRPMDLGQGSFGAWEVATRVSMLDLNPLGELAGVPGPGRRLTTVAVGLNWYLWKHAKAQFNWLNGNLDDPQRGGSVMNAFATRFQVDF